MRNWNPYLIKLIGKCAAMKSEVDLLWNGGEEEEEAHQQNEIRI